MTVLNRFFSQAFCKSKTKKHFLNLKMSVYMCLVVTCWERADLLALVCGVLLRVCYFPIGILGRVWYLIVLIPDLYTLTYIESFRRFRTLTVGVFWIVYIVHV